MGGQYCGYRVAWIEFFGFSLTGDLGHRLSKVFFYANKFSPGADSGHCPNPRVIFWNPNTSQYFLTHQILCQKTTYIECEIAARHDYMRKFHGYKLLREDWALLTGSTDSLCSVNVRSSMFCPKCATELVRRGNELTCAAGEMSLSQNVERILTERYSKHTPSSRRAEPTTEQYPWFCPGCGILLGRDKVCPECQVSLLDLQHQLIEFHPHKNRDGRWT
jgi:hypothetical protein